jgi:predicted DNA-binding mobile mystery protein A
MVNQTNVHERARRHLDERLNPLRSATLTRPPKGWLRAIRDALGMTTRQLAQRAGVSQPTVTAWERSERRDAITLGKLREAAAALDCELVYALIPRQSLEKTVRDRARVMVDDHISRTHHSMQLEDQALGAADLDRERERLIDDLLRGRPSHLWDHS